MANGAAAFAAALVILTAGPAEAVEAGAGAAAIAGSGGYRRLTLFADADWTGARVEPYAWGEAAFSRDLRRFSLGGGAWNNWTSSERGKAGLGLSGGRYDSGRSVGALIVELGAEKDVVAATLGAGWRLTYGSLTSSRGAPSVETGANSRSRGRRSRTADAQSFAVNELSAYGRRRLDAGVLGLRLGVDFLPFGRSILSETVSLRIPAGERLSVTPAVTLEQGGSDAIYFSLSAYCRL